MSTAQEISSLMEERLALVATVKRIEQSLQVVKRKNENAQNAGHQNRLDREHRLLVAELHRRQDELTMANARLKIAQSKLRAEQARARREVM